MSKLGWMGVLSTGLMALIVAVLSYSGVFAASADDRVFEMRTYVAHPDRAEAMHARFRDHTNALFVKHGMKLVGYWTPTDGEAAATTLVYILAHDSRDAAKASWQAFINDPDWQAAKAASEADGPIVAGIESVYMKATDYSPIR